MSDFALFTLCAWLFVVLCARLRSMQYAVFRGVSLGLYSLIAVALFEHVGVLRIPFCYLHATVFLQSLTLVKPRMRPLWYRVLLTIPGLFFSAGMLLAWPWAVVSALGFTPWGFWLPFVVAAFGVVQSLSSKTEERTILVRDGVRVEGVRRYRAAHRGTSGKPLRIVQITDPHLGPFMSVSRLARICQRAVDKQPHLIVLTGDFLTMESQAEKKWLAEGLAPLAQAQGRVFACLGNHDHEALPTVRNALREVGARLLVDESVLCDTEAGPVQIVGFDFRYRERAAHLKSVCADNPRVEGALRLALLHDPGAFKHLPDGEADLVLSGHTHGGQLGLVSLKLSFTVAGWIGKIPDHGLWARGEDRLYVHRGTGHYGFPLRLGVPAEESVLLVYSGTP